MLCQTENVSGVDTFHIAKNSELSPDVFQSWKFQWPGDMYFSHGSNHSKGVLLLIRETLQFELKSVRKDSHGRFIIVEALVQDSPV